MHKYLKIILNIKVAVSVLVAIATIVSMAPQSALAAASLKARWQLNENPASNGTTINDSSGNGRNGSLITDNNTNNKSVVAVEDRGLDLDGNGDYVDITDHADFTLDVSGNYTWSMWINPDSMTTSGGWPTIWSQTNGPASIFYMYAHTITDSEVASGIPGGSIVNGISVQWGDTTSGNPNYLAAKSNDNVLTIGTWSHVVVTYDGSLPQAQRVRVYIDGVDQTSASVVSNGTIASINPSTVQIGHNTAYTGEYYDGKVDDVRFYYGTMTPTEVAQLYASYTLPGLYQEGFRFRDDDGSQTGATWLAPQDTNIVRDKGLITRLRMLVEAFNTDPSSQGYMLEYRKATDSEFSTVPVLSTPSVTWGAIGTGSNGTTSVTPSYPPGISKSTSKIFAVVTGRSNTAGTAPTMPAGWTKILDFEGGTGAWASDTGTRRVTFFQKDVVTGDESGTVTVSLAGTINNTLRASIFRVEVPAGYDVEIATSTGADTTNNTSYSVTGDQSIDWAANDLLLIAVAQNNDAATQSAQSITASGVTFGTHSNQAGVAVTNGNDHRHILDSVPVSSGSGSSAPTYSYTASAAVSGPTGFLRLRAVLNAPIYITDSSNIGSSGANTTAQLEPPEGKTTGSFTAGRIQDDENPSDNVNIGFAGYSEFEWALIATTTATTGDVYQFRVTVGSAGTPFTGYFRFPQWRIGSATSNPGARSSGFTIKLGRLKIVNGKLIIK